MALRHLANPVDPPPPNRRPTKGRVLDRLRRDAFAMFRTALEAVDPERAVEEAIRFEGGFFGVKGHRLRIVAPSARLLAVGKAADTMARGALGQMRIASGLLISDLAEPGNSNTRLRIQMASHPLPDEGSLRAGRFALELTEGLGRGDLLLALISGGASSMMEATSVPLDDLRQAYDVLLRSGLGIRDVNEVRKAISEVKGGRLGERAAARGARVVSLIVSDIVGDPIDDIGSGPTAPNSSRGARAEEILRSANLWKEMPASVRKRLAKAAKAPKVWRDRSNRVHAFVIAGNKRACVAARGEAQRRGYSSRIWTTSLQGEARHVGPAFASRALRWNPRAACVAVIAGGETTVTVRGRGRGGRNQELALAAARVLEGHSAVLLSCGTDGRDGNTDAAGAFVDGSALARAQARGLDPQQFLERNDSHAFFEVLDDLIVTGPTGTNVADIQILLEDRSAEVVDPQSR
jgi:glycerate 2-kinase